MKKIIIFIFLFNLSISSALGMSFYPEMDTGPQAPSALIPPPHQIDNTQNIKNQNIEAIYNNLLPCPIQFENNLDPYEQQDNYNYVRSPYPLIRTVMPLYSIKTTIPPGYYLLTPRKIDSKTFILFKQQGKVLYTSPIFEEVQIDIEQEYPQPKDPYDKAPFGLRSIWKGFGIISGRRHPIPKVPQHKIDCFQYDDKYYGINIYYKDKLYKTVFKIQLYE